MMHGKPKVSSKQTGFTSFQNENSDLETSDVEKHNRSRVYDKVQVMD